MTSRAISDYKERKKLICSTERPARSQCMTCYRPRSHCYCSDLRPQTTSHRIIILIHPEEAKHPIATGRMTHLSLKNSTLIQEVDFSNCEPWLSLVKKDFGNFYLLFPSQESICLNSNVKQVAPHGSKKNFVIIDSKWRMAKRMIESCPYLSKMKKVGFTSNALSQFKVRTQPQDGFLSTIEATAELLERVEPEFGVHQRKSLLTPFHQMVETQVKFTPNKHLENKLKGRLRN